VDAAVTTSVATSADGLWLAARARWTPAHRHWEAAGLTFPVTVDGRGLRVTLIEDLDGLETLREPWTRVGQSAATQSAFLTWEWLSAWSRCFVRDGRRLLVLAVADGPDVIGIAPWYVDLVGPFRLRQVGFLGLPDAASDYLDVIATRTKERLVAEALVEVLFGPLGTRWDTLALKDIPAESPFLSRFLSVLRRAGKAYTVDEGSFCPCVQLPGSFDAYLAQLSSHARQAYRRKMRVLKSKGRVEHVVLTEPGDVRRELATFRDLYERRWGRSQATDDLFGLLRAYHPRAAGAWNVELSLLQVDGRAIAGLLHLTRGPLMYQYLMAIDRSFNPSVSVGTLICGLNIERAIGAGFAEYDFLKSEEEYKFRFMTRGRRALNVTVHKRTARSLVAWSLRAAQHLGKILLR
jgi:CelD/BcsL family acetyltransferase involved in cellulose biosynthesis